MDGQCLAQYWHVVGARGRVDLIHFQWRQDNHMAGMLGNDLCNGWYVGRDYLFIRSLPTWKREAPNVC